MTKTTNPDPARRQRCEIWTRVMGYHRPVSQFNVGKRREQRERRTYREAPLTAPSALAA